MNQHRFPPPQTFAEGQRLIYGWLACAAGLFCGAMAMAMSALLMWGGWSSAEEHTIVVIFGCALGGFIAAMAAMMVGCWWAGRSAGSRAPPDATASASRPSATNDELAAHNYDQARARNRLRAGAGPAGERPQPLEVDGDAAPAAGGGGKGRAFGHRRQLPGRRRAGAARRCPQRRSRAARPSPHQRKDRR